MPRIIASRELCTRFRRLRRRLREEEASSRANVERREISLGESGEISSKILSEESASQKMILETNLRELSKSSKRKLSKTTKLTFRREKPSSSQEDVRKKEEEEEITISSKKSSDDLLIKSAFAMATENRRLAQRVQDLDDVSDSLLAEIDAAGGLARAEAYCRENTRRISEAEDGSSSPSSSAETEETSSASRRAAAAARLREEEYSGVEQLLDPKQISDERVAGELPHLRRASNAKRLAFARFMALADLQAVNSGKVRHRATVVSANYMRRRRFLKKESTKKKISSEKEEHFSGDSGQDHINFSDDDPRKLNSARPQKIPSETAENSIKTGTKLNSSARRAQEDEGPEDIGAALYKFWSAELDETRDRGGRVDVRGGQNWKSASDTSSAWHASQHCVAPRSARLMREEVGEYISMGKKDDVIGENLVTSSEGRDDTSGAAVGVGVPVVGPKKKSSSWGFDRQEDFSDQLWTKKQTTGDEENSSAYDRQLEVLAATGVLRASRPPPHLTGEALLRIRDVKRENADEEVEKRRRLAEADEAEDSKNRKSRSTSSTTDDFTTTKLKFHPGESDFGTTSDHFSLSAASSEASSMGPKVKRRRKNSLSAAKRRSLSSSSSSSSSRSRRKNSAAKGGKVSFPENQNQNKTSLSSSRSFFAQAVAKNRFKRSLQVTSCLTVNPELFEACCHDKFRRNFVCDKECEDLGLEQGWCVCTEDPNAAFTGNIKADFVTTLPPEEFCLRNRIRLTELLSDNGAINMNVDLRPLDSATITNLALHVWLGKSYLLVSQTRGALLLFALEGEDAGAPDVPREMEFFTVLPPSERFRWHSCLAIDALCHVQTATALESGLLVLDRHRLSHFRWEWSHYMGNSFRSPSFFRY